MLLLDDAKRNERRGQQGINTPDSHEEARPPGRLPIGHIVACEEEWYVSGNKHGQHAPPLVDPKEGTVAGCGEDALDQGKEQRHADGTGKLGAHSPVPVFGKVAGLGILGKHLVRDHAGQREHHGQLPAHAYQKDEGGGLIAHRPKRIPYEMPNDGVAYLVEPMHTIESQTSKDYLELTLVNLAPVHIEDHRKNKDEGPVEVLRATHRYGVNEVLCLLGAVTPKLEHGSPFAAVPVVFPS